MVFAEGEVVLSAANMTVSWRQHLATSAGRQVDLYLVNRSVPSKSQAAMVLSTSPTMHLVSSCCLLK